MEEQVYYCAKCKKVYVGGDSGQSDRPTCPQCDSITKYTGFNKTQWLQKTKEERAERLAALENDPAEQAIINEIEEKKQHKSSLMDVLYGNIGKKIKGWAIWIFIIEAIAAVIAGASLMLNDDLGLGVVILFAGPIAAWVSSWLLYAFGELVDKTAANEEHTRSILELMQQDQEKT